MSRPVVSPAPNPYAHSRRILDEAEPLRKDLAAIMASPAEQLRERLDSFDRVRSTPAAEHAAANLLEAAAAALDADPGAGSLPIDPWHAYLELTGRPDFLTALIDAPTRERWAEGCFEIIRRSNYDLERMMVERALHDGDRTLFEELGQGPAAVWSYAQVHRRVRSIAATFLQTTGSEPPRVALLVDNGVDGACCDLACLMYDLLVTPLNVHLDAEELHWILRRLRINIVVTDSEERQRRLVELREREKLSFQLFALRPSRQTETERATLMSAAIMRLAPEWVEALLERRSRRRIDEPCTVMFTSGSTGRPKGVVFSKLHLVSKRFARAAALPEVGRDEVMLCYLPLFHTFGRYLELLGSIFWRGKYVFAGNPSRETLLAGLRTVRPTGLISVPLRWNQIRERAESEMARASDATGRERAFREVVGGRLRWGLSAAGYLEPKAFRFFQRHGVELVSGFGMTEATGGITMSPPRDYVDGTVGRALPGMRLRFTEQGEMWIGGVYVGGYLEEEGEDLEIAPFLRHDDQDWLATGDLFRPLERDHWTIVDRVKDIYKNDRGQTVAPLRVERLFHGVPGIHRTFLVGDHRSWNVLLIVPDHEDPVLREAPDEENRREYFRRIVNAANQELAPYERVVNFALLERDFDVDREELTPKGSYRRKAIEENFAPVIEELYQTAHRVLEVDDLRVRVPRWFYRDLGVLEDDIVVEAEGLRDRWRDLRLTLAPGREPGMVRIGSLEYAIVGNAVDLGVLCRQPRLWVGNPELVDFAPCKEGWDLPLGDIAPHVGLPDPRPRTPLVDAHRIADPQLATVHRISQRALFGGGVDALAAVGRLGQEVVATDERMADTIRQRLTALARHPDEDVRCRAYRVLLLDESLPGDRIALGAFVHSGLSFLNEDSMAQIASTHFEERRLQGLRRRLSSYRQHLLWPADEIVRRQFQDVLRLLLRFVRVRPDHYKPVRAELASWILHREDPELSRFARTLLEELVDWFESGLDQDLVRPTGDRRRQLVDFDDDVPETRREALRQLLLDTSFLKQSILLAFYEEHFDLDQVPAQGIWVSAVESRGMVQLYRVSVNTAPGKHFDLLVTQRDDMDASAVQDTNFWMVVIAGHPFGERVIPRFGCMRPELAATSLEYITELSAEERIRELCAPPHPYADPPDRRDWRRLYLRAMAPFFRAWSHSGRRIVPGVLHPSNVVVPKLDFREDSLLLSLADWRRYRHPSDLFGPLYRSFFLRVQAQYPPSARNLETTWLFDACLEGLGPEGGTELLTSLRRELSARGEHGFGDAFQTALRDYLGALKSRIPRALLVDNAIDRYHTWIRLNPGVTASARADQLEDLVALYRLDRQGERARYVLYRHTYYDEAAPPVREAFDRLLEAMREDSERPATRRVELSDLQATLEHEEDRAVFSRLVFPRAHRAQPLEVLAFGQSDRRRATVMTHVTDSRGVDYDVREPLDPEEIGQLYRLFFQEHLPKTVSPLDRYLVVTDPAERVVGGLIYKPLERQMVHLEGLVVNRTLHRRGIATALLDDFVIRMGGDGVAVIKTGFFMRSFCEKQEFRLDRRWGGLVRILTPEESLAPASPDPG